MAANEVEVIDLTDLTESSDQDSDDEGQDSNSEDSASEASDEDIPLNATSRAQLRVAISTVSEVRLREILGYLVDTNPAVEEALTRQLVARRRDAQAVAPRWDTCDNCDEEYDASLDRKDDECVFHPGLQFRFFASDDFSDGDRAKGELEVDETQFADHDEACHGPMDTLENRRDFPQGFTWTCCDEDGSSEGCVHGEHRPAVPRKRRRI